MHTYVELAKAEFRRYSTYRAATLAGIFTNSIFPQLFWIKKVRMN